MDLSEYSHRGWLSIPCPISWLRGNKGNRKGKDSKAGHSNPERQPQCLSSGDRFGKASKILQRPKKMLAGGVPADIQSPKPIILQMTQCQIPKGKANPNEPSLRYVGVNAYLNAKWFFKGIYVNPAT
jgi:hypothetical protein